MTNIKFGFGAHSEVVDADSLLSLVRRADRDRLDLFSLSDHPYLASRLDAYATIGFALGQTEYISGFANVTNLPLRPAPMLARTVATLSVLARGRIVIGAGAGGSWNHIESMGVPRLTPGQAVESFEESIVALKALLGGQSTGTVSRLDLDAIQPSPIGTTPPVWTGSVGPKSLAVTGRVADGWIPGHAADWLSSRFRASRPVVDDAARAAGRDPADIRTIFNLPGVITSGRIAQPRDPVSGKWIGGSPDQWVDELTRAVTEHGAAGFMLFSPSGGTPDADAVARWGNEIAPRVREEIG